MTAQTQTLLCLETSWICTELQILHKEITYNFSIWVKIRQVQIIGLSCLQMQHLRAILIFPHRALGSTFQKCSNQRKVVLKIMMCEHC